MVDPRFFRVSAPISLTRLAHEAEAEIVNGTNDQYFENVAPLLIAGPKDVMTSTRHSQESPGKCERKNILKEKQF